MRSNRLAAAFFICIACDLIALARAADAQEIGERQAVFDTETQRCKRDDIPDTNARAFRTASGKTYLYASHYDSRPMAGPNLDDVTKQCAPTLQSRINADPAAFFDYTWMGSFFSDGKGTIYALLHNEYHGWAHPGMCTRRDPQNRRGQCWWNNIGFAVSRDDGRTFDVPPPPANDVASTPFPYDKETVAGAVGYFAPSNIQFWNGYYYAMINAWRNEFQRSGACLMRTKDLSNPRSWRAWDGTGFTVAFNDPYVNNLDKQEFLLHTCVPVYKGLVQSLVRQVDSGKFIVSEYTPDSRYGPPGLYIAESSDLISWERPRLIVSTTTLLSREAPGQWKYDYFSLLDPQSTDINYGTITSEPFVYYVRFDLTKAPFTRTLFRQHLELKVGP